MRRTAALLFAAVIALAGCGDDDATAQDQEQAADVGQSAAATPSSPPRSAEPTSEPTESAEPGTEITTGASSFGPMLFDGNEQAIYLFDTETTSEPACYDACAEAWPPVLTDGKPVAAGQAKDSLLGTTERTDGTLQVTYGGHPLYFYAHEAPGEVKCHNVRGFGGLWLVVTPDGEAAD